MISIRDNVSADLEDAEKQGSINMEEVEQICQIVEDKDRQLLLDLMHLKDVELNPSQIEQHGFHPNSQTVSSILVSEVLATTQD